MAERGVRAGAACFARWHATAAGGHTLDISRAGGARGPHNAQREVVKRGQDSRANGDARRRFFVAEFWRGGAAQGSLVWEISGEQNSKALAPPVSRSIFAFRRFVRGYRMVLRMSQGYQYRSPSFNPNICSPCPVDSLSSRLGVSSPFPCALSTAQPVSRFCCLLPPPLKWEHSNACRKPPPRLMLRVPFATPYLSSASNHNSTLPSIARSHHPPSAQISVTPHYSDIYVDLSQSPPRRSSIVSRTPSSF